MFVFPQTSQFFCFIVVPAAKNIKLVLQVPPHQILVYDASGRDVAGAVGPLLEGDNIVLTCEVRGGE